MAQQTRDAEELAYALVTPYSLHKSRTGGILARLLWANVELVAARMYRPQARQRLHRGGHCDAIYDPQEREVPLKYQRMIIEYAVKNFGEPNVRGISNRLALLRFPGAERAEGDRRRRRPASARACAVTTCAAPSATS